jgi:hypothetical protein
MTNEASSDLWFYSQEVPQWHRGMPIAAVDIMSQDIFTHSQVTSLSGASRARAAGRAGEDAFMTMCVTTAARHKVMRVPQYNSNHMSSGGGVDAR